MRKGLIIAAALSFGAGMPAAAEPLLQELQNIVQTHPDVRAAERRLDQARAGVTEARAPFLPQLRISGEYGYENVDSPVNRAQGGTPVEQTREVGRFTVTQKVFDGFRTDGQLKGAIAREFSAGYGLERAAQAILLRGSTAYLNVLKQTELADIALETEANIRRQLALEDERVRRGSGLSVDVLQSKQRLQSQIETRVRIEGQLREAIAEYFAVFNHAPDIAEMEPPPAPDELLPQDLKSAVNLAMAQNPLLKQSQETIGEAKQQRKVAMADFLPQIDIVAEGGIENDNDGVSGEKRDIFVGLRANWELFDGLGTLAATERTGHRIAETMENHAALSLEIARRVEVAWQGLKTLRERQVLAENAANIAVELFNARRKLRRAGRESVVNLLNAEAELNAARSRAVAAYYDAQIQAYRLLFETGTLTLDAY
ncbi:MAG: TolC family protein [Minwuia sp.]|uniref:TolC family protein n=1 Tax=Minwuia sp. TaxID=2493630 RepID=UPI003A86C86E